MLKSLKGLLAAVFGLMLAFPVQAVQFVTTYNGTVGVTDLPGTTSGQPYSISLVFDNGGNSALSQTWVGQHLRCAKFDFGPVKFAKTYSSPASLAVEAGSLETGINGSLTSFFSILFDMIGQPYQYIGLDVPDTWEISNAGFPVFLTRNYVVYDVAPAALVTPTNWSAPVPFSGSCDLSPPSYSIATQVSPVAGGSITCTPNPVASGGSASCTQTPNAGFTFSGWSGDCSGTGTCNLSNVTSAKSVTATYTAVPVNYTVSTSAPGAGSGGTLSCVSPVVSNLTSTCTATPDAGYRTASMSGCGGTATGLGVNAYTTGPVTANCTVTATFSPIPLCVSGQNYDSPTLCVVPAGIASMRIEAWGAGGNGGQGYAAILLMAASGGGGGAYCGASFGVTSGQELIVLPGASGGGASTVIGAGISGLTASGGANGVIPGIAEIVPGGAGGSTDACTAANAIRFAGGAGGPNGDHNGRTGGGGGGSARPTANGANGLGVTVATPVPLGGAGQGTGGLGGTYGQAPTPALPGGVPGGGGGGSVYDGLFGVGGTGRVVMTFLRVVTAVPNPASVGGVLNCAPTSGGVASITAAVSNGETVTCTSSPSVGYRTLSIAGCAGTATGAGVNSFVTGAITSDCTVTATYEQSVNGLCGLANAVPTLTMPSTNLCSVGTASVVTDMINRYDWTCAGSGGGADAFCDARRLFVVTTVAPGAGNGGALSCNSPVQYANPSFCTATPDSGYRTASISGCDGTATLPGVNDYVAGVVSDCTITATFELIANAVCGSANGVATVTPPALAGLCAVGTSSALVSNTASFDWGCNGTGGGTNSVCAAPRQYLVTANAPGAGNGGTLSCTTPATGGTSSSCTAVPDAGYSTQSIAGCGGTSTALGVNSFATGVLSAHCAVAATFVPTTIGQCGTANGVATTIAPTTNLCAVGTASSVSAASGSFNWTCAGSVAASAADDANCSSGQQFTVAASVSGTGGTVACVPAIVNHNGSSTCTAVPGAGYSVASWSGDCAAAGTATTCTLSAITSNKTSSVSFAPTTVGVCGTANGVATGVAPTTGLCAIGTASAVSSAAGSFSWTCSGSVAAITTDDVSCSSAQQLTLTASALPAVGGSVTCTPTTLAFGGNASCTQTTATGYRFTGWSGACSGTGACALSNVSTNQTVTANYVLAPLGNATAGGAPFGGNTQPPLGGALAGQGSASFTTTNGGPTCSFDPSQTGFVSPLSAASATGLAQPHGLFRFRMVGCTPGFTARVTVTWPASLAATSYYKYGRAAQTPLAVDGLYLPQNLVISSNSASFDVTDGGWGDNDLTQNGEIVDPSGPFVAAADASTAAVPTLNEWMLLLLGLFVVTFAARGLRRA